MQTQNIYRNREASEINQALDALPTAELKGIKTVEGEEIRNFRAVKVRMNTGKTVFVNCPSNRYTLVQHCFGFYSVKKPNGDILFNATNLSDASNVFRKFAKRSLKKSDIRQG